MKNLVHTLYDPRDPSYPFSNTYICSNCNERLTINDTECKICDLYIYGMIKKPAEVGETNKKTVNPNYNTVLNAKNVKSNVSQTLDTSLDVNLDTNFSDIFKQSFMLLIVLSLLLIFIIGYDFTQNIISSIEIVQ